MIVDLVSTTTSDNIRLDGALLAPTQPPAAPAVDAVLCLPGVGGNFYSSGLLEEITPPLRAAGLHVLWANTRGHDAMNTAAGAIGRRRQQGAAFEMVSDCRHDVTAWLDFLTRERGLQRIAVFGHSLGAIKALYAQAHAPHTAAARLIAVSPPRLSCSAFMNSPQSSVFFASLAAAEEALAAGKGETLLESRFPFPLLIAADAFVDKYGRAENYNILRFIDRLRQPTLFVYGEAELATGIAFAGMPAAVREHDAGHFFDVTIIPAADHFYRRQRPQLAAAILTWLQS